MRRESVVTGIAFVLLSSLVFAPVVQACSKYLLLAFPVVQVMWVRSAGHALWMVVIFWRSHGLGMFKTKRPGLQFARSVLLSGCSIVWLLAIPHVQLASAAAIMFTTPMFVALLSIPMLGERVGMHRFGAIGLGFVGVLLVIRPAAGEMVPEMLYIVSAALMYAVYQILTRKVSVDDSAATSAVYAVAVGAVCASFFVPFDYRIPGADDWPHWLAFLAISFFGGVRHLFVVKAFEHAPASVVSPFCYTELIGVSILGAIMFSELPDQWTWAGAALIVVSGLYIAHRESRATKTAS
jgi:drug/metabolite transporter (DMT)-like permease